MATATEEPRAAVEIPEPIPERSDITKAKRHVFNRHLAHEGLMLDKMQRQIRHTERLQKFAATGDVKHLEPPEGEEDDGMGVNIGNENHWHIEMKEQPKAPQATAPTVVSAAKSIWPTLLLAGSMLGGGAGLGYIIHEFLKPQTNPASVAGIDTDTDTIVEMDFP